MPNEVPGEARNEAANPIALRQWDHARAELNQTVGRYLALERAALFSTALIWTVLAATSNADWDPLIKWLPLVLNVLFALRAFALALRVGTLERFLATAERHLAVPPELQLETQRGARRVGLITVLVFWLLLLAVTAVLPHFYIERATEPDYNDPSMTLHTPGVTPDAPVLALGIRSAS
jgi:hypothetical protein